MKTIYLIFIFAYAAPTVIAFVRLLLDEKTKSLSHFANFWIFAFIPVYNVILTYFVALELRDAIKRYFK